MILNRHSSLALATCLFALLQPATPTAKADVSAVTNSVPDRLLPVPPGAQTLGGLLEERCSLNRTGHLLQVDTTTLLKGFEKRPGAKWVGEHAGKLLDAASRDYAYSHDAALRAKYGEIESRLLAMQLPDGYLGTYLEKDRWTSWDVWSHKYDLIGLLSYHEAFGDAESLAACQRIGDLLCQSFGPQPGQRDILKAGEHMGMAATSVLEPMVRLYRVTGQQRYLDFCRYLVDSLDRPGGPGLIKSLTEHGNVFRTANAKSYEMLSNLNGLLELYRITGEKRLLTPVLRAWADIVGRRLYITGSTSSSEHFLDDHELPVGTDIKPGEGCVTVTWAQLNWNLLRLTGETRYADELERTVYNHLLGAQDPRSGKVCFYPPLIGPKSFAGGLSYCCVSSIARGIAMLPSFVSAQTADGGLALVLYSPGELNLGVGPTKPVKVKLVSETDFPQSGKVTLRFQPEKPARFPLLLRVPSWTSHYVATTRGQRYEGRPGSFLRVEREWKETDTISIDMTIDVQLLRGGKSYPDLLAVKRGPQVLSLERALNPELVSLPLAALASDKVSPSLTPAVLPQNWPGRQAYKFSGLVSVRKSDAQAMEPESRDLMMVPFADSIDGRVWIARPDKAIRGRVSLTAFRKESASRPGTVQGSICDEQSDTFRNTENFNPELDANVMDWFAVELDRPYDLRRVVYMHGKVDPKRGGWFVGKPQIQVQRKLGGPWETVTNLDSYPEVPEGKVPTIPDCAVFEQRFSKPETAVAIRVLGRPGKGSRPDKGRSASCAELQAYTE